MTETLAPASTGHDRLETILDGDEAVIHVVTRGFLGHADIEACFREVGRRIAGLRMRGRAVRVLVDTRGAPILSAEIADLLRTRTSRLYRSGDRVAMLAESRLAQMQMKRVLDMTIHRLFSDEAGARDWLAESD